MEIFKQTNIASLGMFTLGSTCYSKAFPIQSISIQDEMVSYDAIEFYTPSGYLLERYYVNLPNTIFTDYEFVNDRDGCISFKLTLAEYPKFQILRFTKVVWVVSGKINFTGYIESVPLQGEDKISISGYGMSKRLEKTLIVNPYANNLIKSMSKVDATMTVYLHGNKPNINLLNLKIVIRECTEDKNNTKANAFFNIDSYGGIDDDWFITYQNASGLNQPESKGIIDILPSEWSYSNLRSTVIDYCIRNLTRNQVKYNPALIEQTTGYITSGTVNFHNMEYAKFVKEMKETLPESYRFGVNELGYFFLKNQYTEIIDKYFEEYDFYEPDLKEEVDKVVNNVSILREGEKKKWSVAAIASDQTSISLYGELAKKINVPYAIEDATAQSVANIYLANNKEPKYNISIKNRPFEIKEFGYYGIVTKEKNYINTINQMDTLDNWITTGATVSIANDDYISGSGCHRLVFSGSCSHRYTYSAGFNSIGIKKVGFYIQTNIQGLLVKFLVNNKEFETIINTTGYYIPIEFDLLGINEINTIMFIFNTTFTSRTYSVKIDNITITQNTNIHYSMPLKKQTWKSSKGIKIVDCEYGMLETNKLADFVGSTNSSMSSNTLMIQGN